MRKELSSAADVGFTDRVGQRCTCTVQFLIPSAESELSENDRGGAGGVFRVPACDQRDAPLLFDGAGLPLDAAVRTAIWGEVGNWVAQIREVRACFESGHVEWCFVSCRTSQMEDLVTTGELRRHRAFTGVRLSFSCTLEVVIGDPDLLEFAGPATRDCPSNPRGTRWSRELNVRSHDTRFTCL